MFRLLVIGKTSSGAQDAAEWVVSGEKAGEMFEKKYEIAGRSITLAAMPVSPENPAVQPVCDGVLLVAKTPADLSAVEGFVQNYIRVPIKFILYDGAPEQTEFEVKLAAKGIQKKSPVEFVEMLISANNDLIKLIATVFNSFDKDHSGYIELAEIKALAKELGSEIPEEEAKQIMSELDINKDGRISMEEFVEWWKTGRQAKGHKFASLLEGWLKKYPLAQKLADAVTKVKGSMEIPEKMIEGSFAFHINRVTAPGIRVEFKVMTKGKDMQDEFQIFNGAVGLKPTEPFFGLAFGVKNPKEACGKLRDVADAGIMMAQSFFPPAAEALSHVEFKYGETTNKVVACVVPSVKGSNMIAPFIGAVGPLAALMLPGQLIDASLSFATDLNKLVTEEKPFYELLLDGITFEVKTLTHPMFVENAKMIATSMPLPIPHHMMPKMAMMMQAQSWADSGKGEIEFEVDQVLKDMIKNEVGPHPASMPLRDLKAMLAPQVQEVISNLPIAEMVHTFFKDEVSSLDFFIYVSELVAIKLSFNLPGLGSFIAL